MCDVFISHATRDKEAIALPLARALEERGYSVWYDEFQLKPSISLRQQLEAGLKGCRFGLAIISRAYLASHWTNVELDALLALEARKAREVADVREVRGRIDLVILVRHGMTADELADEAPLLAGRFTLSTDGGLAALVEMITRVLGPPADKLEEADDRPGWRYTVEEAFERLPPPENQAFAVELLTRPVRLTRHANGRITVTVDRDGVSHAVVTTEGKNQLCNHYLSAPDVLLQAHELDRRIDRFFRGADGEAELTVPMDRWRLRWASGGVLSVVRWKDRLWTPFFFRDIEPLGWNISLGSSERGDDLSNPWTFQIREFLEETLVLTKGPGASLDFKRFYFDQFALEQEIRRAETFAARHIALRVERDGLRIRNTPVPATWNPLLTATSFQRTHTELRVVHRGTEHPPRRDVLVCINLLELGIEVVKVVEYEMENDECILDGEAYETDGEYELVRMPVALIAHDYLRRVFGRSSAPPAYAARLQPSWEGPGIPPRDIHIFPFDAERRLALARAEQARPWERERYTKWVEAFGSRFFDRHGRVTNAHAVPLFTPASAKILTYYFADPVQQRR